MYERLVKPKYWKYILTKGYDVEELSNRLAKSFAELKKFKESKKPAMKPRMLSKIHTMYCTYCGNKLTDNDHYEGCCNICYDIISYIPDDHDVREMIDQCKSEENNGK